MVRKNTTNTIIKIESSSKRSTKSVVVTVKILPNRKDIRFGAYPGVRNIKIIPTAIPSAQRIPIAESSLIPFLCERASIPKADRTEKIVAPRIGFNPR
jgi:hypothetical protein